MMALAYIQCATVGGHMHEWMMRLYGAAATEESRIVHGIQF